MESSNGSDAGTKESAPPTELLAEASSLVLEGWSTLSDSEASARLERLERLSRIIDGAKINGAAELGVRARAGRYDTGGAANPIALLRDLLRISPQEASRRLAIADATHDVLDNLTLNVTPTKQPAVAKALAQGEISQDMANTLIRHVDQVQHLEDGGRVPEGTAATVEARLTEIATQYAPDYVDKCANRAINHLDPDGNKPTEGELLAKEGITFSRPRRGLMAIHGHITVADYEDFMTAFGTATNPRATGNVGTQQAAATAVGNSSGTGSTPLASMDVSAQESSAQNPTPQDSTAQKSNARQDALFPNQGPMPDWAHEVSAEPTASTVASAVSGATAPIKDTDEPADFSFRPFDQNGEINFDRRTRAQKLLHALVDCGRKLAQLSELPDNGGLKPQLIVSVTLEDLRSGLGSAHVPFSGDIPASEARRIACDCNVIPAVLGSDSDVLDYGRSFRIVPENLRRLLISRDHGCAFPGCDRPAPWTEAHHIIPWAEGGETSLDNSVLVCSRHHHLVHRSEWGIKIEQGYVYFTPPISIDPLQRPRRNYYHHPQGLLDVAAA